MNEVLDHLEMKEESVPYMAAELAVRIDDAIQAKCVVDWQTNWDVQNEMRNSIDDVLYQMKGDKGMPLSHEDMDNIIERSLEIAKVRYRK